MTTIFDLVNPPRKKPDDYIEFITLSSDTELFDDRNSDVKLSRSELRRCEALYRTPDDRWILAYPPFPGEIPPWVNLDELPEGLQPWEAPTPPAREIGPAEVTQWHLLNQHEMPQSFRAVLKVAHLGPPDASSRLHHAWRPTSEPIPPSTTSTSPPMDATGDKGSTASSVGSGKVAQTSKVPSEEAVQAYRLQFILGGKQADIARQMSKELGRRIGQGSVSRYIKQAQEWIKAGNVLPDLPDKVKKPASIDPARLDLGRRTDGRSSRQRSNSDD